MKQPDRIVKTYRRIEDSRLNLINVLLKDFALYCGGGSYVQYTDGSNETFIGFTSERGGSVPYDKDKVSRRLQGVGFTNLVLDGSKMY